MHLARHLVGLIAAVTLLSSGAPAARAECPHSTLFYGALDPANPIPEVVLAASHGS